LTINIARPREERPPRWDNHRGEQRSESRDRL
jgi:hypothetical protein